LSKGSAHAKPKIKKPKQGSGLDSIMVIRLAVAAVIFAVSLIIDMPKFLSLILLVLSAVVAGYDIVLSAINAVEEGDYFATPLVIVFVSVIAYVIGFGVEGAALLILYQIGLLLIAYADERTKKTAMELLQYQDEETVTRISDLIRDKETGYMEIESVMKKSSGNVLKIAMLFAVVYAAVLPLATSFTFTVSIHRALTIIIIATPMSVIAAMRLTGIMGLCYSAREGIIFNNAKSMESAGLANVAVFDKEGIFTASTPRLLSVQSDFLDNNTFMSFVSHAVFYSDQPFAKAVAAANDQEYKLDVISDFVDMPGRGVDLKIGGARVTLASSELFASRGVYVPDDTAEQGKTYYMTVSDRYVGKITVSDEINQEAAELADNMKSVGIKRCILLTEDGNYESQRLAEELDFSEVYGECDTAKKLKLIEDLNEGSANQIIYIYANGIEAHSGADIDIRVNRKGKYSDAVAYPDFVSNIPFAIQVCNRVREVAITNALFAFIVKAVLIFLSIVGYCNIWFAVFIDMVAAIATVLNTISVTKESFIRSLKYKAGK